MHAAGSLEIPVLTGIGNHGGKLCSSAASPEAGLEKSAVISKLEISTGHTLQ